MKQIVGQIISGGQTGADRAALDFAIKHQIPHGGWCPLGRLASDGPLASQYQLKETESRGYLRRTKLNVQDSDATLIFNSGVLSGGTLQTVRFAQAMNKPCRVFQLDQVEPQNVALEVQEWLSQIEVVTINIAGPREAKRPGIYGSVMLVLEASLLES
jgi:hypothetical protein